jgi:hypothetical protein
MTLVLDGPQTRLYRATWPGMRLRSDITIVVGYRAV